MDLTNQTSMKFAYELDEDNILTITIADESAIELGTIVIENSKFRSLMQAMTIMSEERVTSLMYQTGYTMAYEIQANTAEVTFR